MSGTRQTATRAVDDDLGDWVGGGLGGMIIEGDPVARGSNLPVAQPVTGGMATDRALAQIVTAQRVAVKRMQSEIRRNISLAAQVAGSDYFYRWEVNNNRTKSKDVIEGISIHGAMAVARLYGNCAARCIVASETATHWHLVAEFVDYETGFTLQRPFQQRKSQNTGMKDQDRAADLVFQIAASKAVRNVIRGVLGDLCDFAMEEAKRGLLAVIQNDPAKAKTGVIKMAQKLGIDGPRIERVIGRAMEKWTVTDIATAASRLRSIDDGFASADDLFPTAEQVAEAEAREAGGDRPEPKAQPVQQAPAAAEKPEGEALPPRQARRAPPAPPPAPVEDTPPPPTGDDEDRGPPLDLGGE
jgi:hypothetical protein